MQVQFAGGLFINADSCILAVYLKIGKTKHKNVAASVGF